LKSKRLKVRVLVWFGSMTFVILLLFSLSFYYLLNQSINQTIETELYHQARYVQEEIIPELTGQKVIEDDRLSDVEVAVIVKGEIRYRTKAFTLKYFKRYLQDRQPFFMIEHEEYLDAGYRLQFEKPFRGMIIVYKKGIKRKIESVIEVMLWLNPLLLLLLIATGSRLVDKILLPIQRLTQRAQEISVRHFSDTIPEPKEEDELKELVHAFNAMIERLKHGVEKLDRFNSDVSHELKTPLTVIRGEIELTLRKVRKPEVYQQSMQTILYEAQQIQKIVEELLLLTRYSSENIAHSFQTCDLDAILLETIEHFTPQLQAKNLHLYLAKIEQIRCQANPTLIGTIFSNLLENAIKYSIKGKKISISLYRDSGIHFVIEDEGIGIPEDQIANVTDRFYRADSSRNKKIKGFGLGLAIVKNSLDLHQGSLKIESVEGVGTIVHVTL